MGAAAHDEGVAEQEVQTPLALETGAEVGPPHPDRAISTTIQLIDTALTGRRNELAEVLGVGLLKRRRIDRGRRGRHTQQGNQNRKPHTTHLRRRYHHPARSSKRARKSLGAPAR